MKDYHPGGSRLSNDPGIQTPVSAACRLAIRSSTA
jgi:hypothetical protein